MRLQNILFLLTGLLGGLALGLAISPGGPGAPPVPTAVVSAAPTASEAASPAPEAPSPAASDWPEWDQTAVYNGGDKVLYQGRIYRAKWWTQGETPDTADVWEDTLEAPGSGSVQTAPDPLPPAEPVLRAEGFKVVGYFPSWKPGETGKVRLDVLTHLNYAFAIPTAEGGLRPLDNPDTARALIRDAHAAGVQVLLAVGGWSYNDVPLEAAFISATETEAKRAAFAQAIVDLCGEYGFDGVDMDWEHPRVDGPSRQQYEELMLDLAGRLHAQGKLLTSAVLSGATADGNVYYDAAAHSDKVLAAVDWINVMAYDGGDGERHSPYSFAVDCGTYWRDARGVPAEKVVLGLPFYARPSWAGYGDILASVPAASAGDTVEYNGMTAWYNGPQTIRDKTRYALQNLGGVMIWEVTQDTADREKSLQSAIAAELEAAAG